MDSGLVWFFGVVFCTGDHHIVWQIYEEAGTDFVIHIGGVADYRDLDADFSLRHFLYQSGTDMFRVDFVFFYEHEYATYMVEKERQLNTDRIRQINRQMQPHFIFNSLTTIRALCENSPETVEVINAFAGFLRGSIDMLDEPNCIPARKEFDTVRHYLNMEQKRFGIEEAASTDQCDCDHSQQYAWKHCRCMSAIIC